MKIQVVITDGKVGNAYRGEILEDGILVGRFSQRSPKTGAWPMQVNFFTSFAKDRFLALADLSAPDIIELMLMGKGFVDTATHHYPRR